ncbi:TPA: serine protease [Providencia rettgeri]
MHDENYRQGNIVLKWSDTSKAYKILTLTGNPELMYEYLASKGDRYALLANSVVKGDSFSGAFALNYLEEVMIENEHEFNEDLLTDIRLDMAFGYLESLRSRFKAGEAEISGDINHKEAMMFHERVFEKYKLPADAWTLQPVFDVTPDETTREAYWQKALDAVGNTEKEAELSLWTLNMMFDGLYSASASKQPQIHRWLGRVADLDNVVAGIQISLKNTYGFFETPKYVINPYYIKALVYETGNPLIDRGTNRFSFWDFPYDDNDRFSVQTDWRGKIEFIHKNPLSEYYLERPDYVLPETGLFDSSSINYKPDVEHYDRMIDNIKEDMSSINNKSTPPIKYPHNRVLDHNYPKIEPHRELAPLTTHLFDTLKPENTEEPKNHYLERPSVVLPETHGFKDFPEDTFQHNRHFENMIGQLRDNMSSMNNSMSSFDDRYSMPSMPSIPEFSYSGYSSGNSFGFN